MINEKRLKKQFIYFSWDNMIKSEKTKESLESRSDLFVIEETVGPNKGTQILDGYTVIYDTGLEKTFHVAPLVEVYSLNALNEFLRGLVPEGLTPNGLVDFHVARNVCRGDREIFHFGHMWFFDDLGSVHTEQVYEIDDERGDYCLNRLHFKDGNTRRTTHTVNETTKIRAYPSQAIAVRYRYLNHDIDFEDLAKYHEDLSGLRPSEDPE
jgi:hypothetical protein